VYRTESPTFQETACAGADGWRARIDIELSKREETTFIQGLSHQGPLRVQRPFYPEGKGTCHIYLLHPPGGMVTGDALNVCATLNNGAHAVFTTPSAGKIYRGNSTAHKQKLQVELKVKQGSMLEWLPQETIVFSGARGELFTSVELQDDSQVLLWDVVCLGRPASGEIFDKGYLVQKLLLRNKGKTIYRERNVFAGSDLLLKQVWGMAMQPVAGTMLASCRLDEATLQLLREQLSEVVDGKFLAVSQLPELLIARYVGSSTEECRRGFECVRDFVRPLMCKGSLCNKSARPRIWNT
jgi:urease accessory protein